MGEDEEEEEEDYVGGPFSVTIPGWMRSVQVQVLLVIVASSVA